MRSVAWWVMIGWMAVGCSEEREHLIEELGSPKPVIRAGAVQALAAAGDEEAFLLLSRSLDDPSVVVRTAVVRSVLRFKDRQVHNLLIRASRDADPEVREAAAQALSQLGGEVARRALVDMLAAGENQLLVRRAVLQALERLGRSGESLAQELGQAEMKRIREQLAEAQGIRRAQLIVRAGYSVDPDGLAIVLEGLRDPDPEVAQAALAVLDGRGGAEALRQVQRLAGELSEEIRSSALRQAARFGADGRVVLRGALRDGEPGIRRLALQLLARGQAPAQDEACLLLADPDEANGEIAARLAGEHGLDCDPGGIEAMMQRHKQPEWRQAVRRLSLLRSARARARLGDELAQAGGDERLWLIAALLQAGEKRPAWVREIQTDVARRVAQVAARAESWVGGRLPAAPRGGGDMLDRTRLSQEQLDRLYQKYGIDAPSENAPRSVSDLLRSFPEHAGPRPVERLCPLLTEEEEALLQFELDGLAPADADGVRALAETLLRAIDPRDAGWLAALLNRWNIKLPANAFLFERWMAHYADMDLDTAREVAQLLGRTGDGAAMMAMLQVLPRVPWEKREWLIQALAGMKRPEATAPMVGTLIQLLPGTSASTAADALAEIGDASAIEPLRAAVGQAAPGQEMHILMALARLGDRETLPRVLERLEDPDPEVRLAALQVLEKMGGEEARKAIGLARLDLDRRVRAMAEQLWSAGGPGGDAHGRPDTQPEGPGGADAAQGPDRESPGTVPESPGQPAGR